MSERTRADLQYRQRLPLDIKVAMTRSRIREWINWYGEEGVYVSFSGGKDSTVLLDIVRKDYPGVPAVFADIPTQYPELKQFAKTFENLVIVKPEINFFQVCEKYGFPFFGKEISNCIHDAKSFLTKVEAKRNAATDRQTDSVKSAYALADLLGIERRHKDPKRLEKYQLLKTGAIPSEILENAPVRVKQVYGVLKHKSKGVESNEYSKMYDKSQYAYMVDAPFDVSGMCCKVMKKAPLHKYGKKVGRVPITAQTAEESRLRTSNWIKHGCNAFDAKTPISNPMSFWTEQDVLKYIKENDLPICSVYGKVVSDAEEMGQLSLTDFGIENAEVQEKLHCTGCQRTGCELCAFGAHMPGDKRFLDLKETHPKMYKALDVAKNNGYTMRQAIEWVNAQGHQHICF